MENNLFVDCDPAVDADGRGLDPSPVWRDMVDTYMRRQLAAVPSALYRERYPAMKTLDAYFGPPDGPGIVGVAFKGCRPGATSLRGTSALANGSRSAGMASRRCSKCGATS